MKTFTASALAFALAATSGVANAQSYYDTNGRDGYGAYGSYGQPQPDRYGQSAGAVYDQARVLRVDPVIASGYGYGEASGTNCRYTQSTYSGRDGYYGNDRYGDDRYYGNDRYGNDRYGDPYYGRGGYDRRRVRVTVVAEGAESAGSARATIVRRYREYPTPLVRHAVRGWRTGRLDAVLAGGFDLVE